MADQWYYGYGQTRQGPFTGQQLKELAEAGKIQPMDTVWKEGVEPGVPALRVKNLFPEQELPVPAPAAVQAEPESPAPTAAPVPPAAPAPERGEDQASAPPAASAPAEATAPTPADSSQDLPHPSPEDSTAGAKQKALVGGQAKKGRALAGNGAVIVSQDGYTVYFRKKCTKCGYEDLSKSRMPIRNGVTRAGFFCPKCRKLRQVEIQGMV
jgi:outer membrane biosynthesis protein TonB